MNIDYRFPLFDVILQGSLNPLLMENNADSGFILRLQEQIIEKSKDEGRYALTFIKWKHPKAEYYRELLVNETFAYCNELIASIRKEENTQIRAYYREIILDRHLTTSMRRLGEVITKTGLKTSILTRPTPDDTIESLANSYVLHLLKVCLAKAYLEVQLVLSEVVFKPQTEIMLYSAYFHELPPVKTYLVERNATQLIKTKKGHSLEKSETNTPDPDSGGGVSDLSASQYILVKEAASILKVGERTIRRRLESNEIKGIKDKGKWLIDKVELNNYLNGLNKQIK